MIVMHLTDLSTNDKENNIGLMKCRLNFEWTNMSSYAVFTTNRLRPLQTAAHVTAEDYMKANSGSFYLSLKSNLNPNGWKLVLSGVRIKLDLKSKFKTIINNWWKVVSNLPYGKYGLKPGWNRNLSFTLCFGLTSVSNRFLVSKRF